MMKFLPKAIPAAVLLLMANLCVAGRSGSASPRGEHPQLTPAAALGRKIFFDRTLSDSGRMSCATCHDPAYAYGPPNGLAVQKGGPELRSPGFRAVPSLRYILRYVPRWTQVRATNPIEQLTETDGVPAGGYTWDGRFDSLHAQAMFPFFSPQEMDNRSNVELAAKLSRAAYAGDFRALFGRDVFTQAGVAVHDAAEALQQFELQDESFQPYTSKFDAWLDGKAEFTAQEARGKQLFDDPQGGNCASCHLDEKGANGAHPLFTDFQFEAVGVPRNQEIPWNRDPHYDDLGLCGPFRTDLAGTVPSDCGLFRTPSLRNAAARHVFFHNGRFHSLRETLRFYVERDTNPGRWYPTGADGHVEKFDDLPPRYRRNIDIVDAPLNRKLGQQPIWNEQNIDDVIAFLKTLVDQDVSGKGHAAP